MTIVLIGGGGVADEELIALLDEAVADLKATTVTYRQWLQNVAAGKYADTSATRWGAAFALIDTVQDALRARSG